MKLAKLATEREALTGQIKALDADTRTLEGAVLILSGHRTGVGPSKPRPSYESPQLSLEREAFIKVVLEVLRDAEQPLAVVETNQAALARLCLPQDVMTKSKLATKVMTAATSHVREGTLRRVERENKLNRLEVARLVASLRIWREV